jgi:DNA-directed RNA polymerase subunit RPC12/RpoP
MGSTVEYQCPTCGLATGQLKVGWGKAGRAAFWGGLALCAACKEIMVIDLADTRVERRSDRRCARCSAPLKLIEGTADSIRCPGCATALKRTTVGTWS